MSDGAAGIPWTLARLFCEKKRLGRRLRGGHVFSSDENRSGKASVVFSVLPCIFKVMFGGQIVQVIIMCRPPLAAGKLSAC